MLVPLVEYASQYIWVKTSEPEGVNEISQLLTEMGLPPSSAWCAAFVQHCLKHVGIDHIFRSANCVEIWQNTHPEYRIRTPEPGCLIVWQHEETKTGHIGIVTQILNDTTVETVEGNTTPASTIDRSGDGVYLKQRHNHVVAGPMKLLGFLSTVEINPA